jgi:hypothetical protein
MGLPPVKSRGQTPFLMESLYRPSQFRMEAQRAFGSHSSATAGHRRGDLTSGKRQEVRIMMDVILDCFGALVLLGQAALFLASGQL